MSLVINGTITLWHFVDSETCERVFKLAELPKNCASDWEGLELNVLDWKIDGQTVKVTYQTSKDVYAPIFDAVWPLREQRIKLSPPNRSKNWEWQPFFSNWRNRKTGERVPA